MKLLASLLLTLCVSLAWAGETVPGATVPATLVTSASADEQASNSPVANALAI